MKTRFIFLLLVFVNFGMSSCLFGDKVQFEFDDYIKTEMINAISGGFVPDEGTAIKIAEAVWISIYGEMVLEKKPFNAILKGDVWYVSGTLPNDYEGGVPIAKIRKSDGAILGIINIK